MTLASARGAVYFIEGARRVKVGWTTRAPAYRLRQLQGGSPLPLVLVAALPAFRSLEASLHERMDPWRDAGEWFLPNPVIQSALDVATWVGWNPDEPFESDSTGYSTVGEVEEFGSYLATLFDSPRAPRRLSVGGVVFA